MGRLVAVIASGGPLFVDALRRAWERGDAVLPLDPRLPGPARRRLVEALQPASVVDPAVGAEELARFPGAPPVEEGDALVVATSGTTGASKGVVLTHAAVTAHARAVHARLDVTGADRWLACLPLAHVGGLGVVVRAVVDGVGLEVHDGFDATAVTASRRGGATLTSLVPTALDRVGAEGWRWVVLGGSADTVGRRPANVVRTWGLTETGGGVVYDGTALPEVEVEARDGELWVRSPTLTRGYRDRDGTVTDPRDGDGWLATGDAGAVAADGTVAVHGRKGDMIVTGGENVWPDPVEAVLRGLAGVAEVAVAGRPDPTWGQRVEAWVVPVAGISPPTLDAVRAAVGAQLAPWAAPRRLHLVASLPRTALGKVRRSALP